MLHQKTVEPRTLELLKDLMRIEELKAFALLGGTSLSLRWGHRQSEDLDLFSNQFFEEDRLIEALESKYPNLTISLQQKQTLRLFIENVKIEIIAPKRPYLKPFEDIGGIRFFSAEDAMAFKMNAIERRGSRKDFYDLAEALHHFSLTDLIGFYQQKFSTHDLAHLIKSIAYFEDAEQDFEPNIYKPRTWDKTKKIIQTHLQNYLKNLVG